MRWIACRHEAEVRQLLQLGHWPESTPAELRSHVASCRGCGDLVLLTQAFRDARASAAPAAVLPPASVLWWRAQLRRRNAAVQRIQRPLFGAQVFALVTALLVLAATIAYEAAREPHWTAAAANWLSSLAQSPAFRLDALWPFSSGQIGVSLIYLVPCASMLVLLGGVALYLVSEKQ